jgi:5-methylthioadenosine/S-adenosylhomocysteine deaminase
LRCDANLFFDALTTKKLSFNVKTVAGSAPLSQRGCRVGVPVQQKVIAMSDNPVGPVHTSSAQTSDGAGPLTVIRNARVLTMDPTCPQHACADIVIEHGTIRAIAPDASLGIRDAHVAIDGTGHLVMPGLINAHFHSPTNFLKGALDSLPLELFMLYEVPATPDAAVSARSAYVRTQIGAAEMLKLGVTSVQDDAFFLPVPSHAEIDAVMGAYRDIGMRATVALDQPNLPEIAKLPFLGDIVPAELRTRLEAPAPMQMDDLLHQYRYLLDTWHQSSNGRLRAAV